MLQKAHWTLCNTLLINKIHFLHPDQSNIHFPHPDQSQGLHRGRQTPLQAPKRTTFSKDNQQRINDSSRASSSHLAGQRGTKNVQNVPVLPFSRAVGNKKRPKRARPSIPRGREERGRKVKGQDARAHSVSHAEILEGGVWEFRMAGKHR